MTREESEGLRSSHIGLRYLWRRRQEALLLRRYKEKLEKWEQEGYDVSGFEKGWFK